MSSSSTSQENSTRKQNAIADTAGLSVDELQLRAQGHVGELPRQFGRLATFSVAFSITNSWVGYTSVFVTPLAAGGGPTVIYGLIVAAIVCSIITAGMAELASAFPSSGGQYHFAFMVSPVKYRAPISFTMGWLSTLSWWFTCASAPLYIAQIIGNIANYFHPDFVYSRWQIYLIFLPIVTLCISLIVLVPKFMPAFNVGSFIVSLTGLVVSFIVVLALSPEKQPASVVFKDWNNLTGWPDGLAFMIGAGQCMYSFVGTDGATHLAEEMPNPGRGVPRVMMLTMVIGIVTVFAWVFAFMFSTNDLTAIATSPLPVLAVLDQAMGSKPVAAFFTLWQMVAMFGAATSSLVGAGRLAWAFARDNGLVYSSTFAKVHPKLQVPMNATILTGTFVACYGAIFVASTTAFNSVISLAILGLNVSYVVPQTIVLIRGRDKCLPERQFDLGPILGPFCNAVATIWMLFYSILFCFPTYLPATLDNMNYLSVVVTGVLVFVAIFWWCSKRKYYTGPDIPLDGLEVLSARNSNEAQIESGGSFLAKSDPDART